MSEAGASPSLQSLLSLRNADAQRFDPARFHYLEVLSRRASAATGALQPILQAKLATALADYSQRMGQAQGLLRPAPNRGPGPLAELNHYIRRTTQPSHHHGPRPELKSVRGFREVWSKIAAIDHMDQAMVRGPENAGPLNPHMLVLRSLALMRQLSPEYLQRFLSHVDSLLWLDQENQKHTPAEAKPARKSRPKK
ncbi:hypothetical protein os1_01750 [Comamonadaceae bacterium OS-1]|nr:hypothetical protein os1_01750 [Comamonadaceae bacterium OS-1]